MLIKEEYRSLMRAQRIVRIAKGGWPYWGETVGQLADPPVQLFYRGKGLPEAPVLAVVGPRKHTPYAAQIIPRIVGEAARAGIHIVSGLAYGVDALAHRAALDVGGLTSAVLAGGVDDDRIGPRRNWGLAQELLETGSLISEMPPGYPARKHDFRRRNRIVAALSKAVLVIEGHHSSGSLITARFAMELGKDVFAIPQNISSRHSCGVNELIKQGALVCTDPEDILQYFGIAHKKKTVDSPILRAINDGHTTVNQISTHLSLPTTSLLHELTMLEIDGTIRKASSGDYIVLI